MKYFNKLIIPIIITIVFICSSNIQWGGNNWKDIIAADGKGYYAYLPAMFIYNDLNFGFFDSIEKKYPNPEIFYEYRIVRNGKTANKYFVGVAIALLPFFSIAHLTAEWLGYDADGYSKIYLIMINIASIVYLLMGLIYLKKLLKNYNCNESLISFILVAITFGTNLFYYTVGEPAMSHIYSFTFITIFLYYLKLLFTRAKSSYIIILSLLLGLIVIIRPINGLIILITPFVAQNKEAFTRGLKYLKKQLATSIWGLVLFIAIVLIQLIIYKIQTGSFWIDSYGDEKFNWLQPHPIDFLFSYKKGLFLYTPISLIALLGIYSIFKENKFEFYSFVLFSVVLLYVLSSWWSWWYGGSFSSRVVIEYYALLAILLHYAYQYLKSKWSKIIYSSLIICLIIICQIQTYQYRYHLIHWEKMDKAHYWKVFLRADLIGKENQNRDLLEH